MDMIEAFQPDWVSPPGATILDLLEDKSVSMPEFAESLGCSLEDAQELIQGRTAITIGLARSLEATLGASVEFWMTRDQQYRSDASRIHDQEREWLREIPVGDMVRFGWLSPPPRPSEETAACLDFFGVSTVQAWRDTYLNTAALTAFRKSPSFDSHPAAVAAWVRRGMVEAEASQCAPWDATAFGASLAKIRHLSRMKRPGEFLPRLGALCADAGVVVAVVRTPAGCRASGAAMFVSASRGLIMLSARHLSDDHFWFTFFHEAGHLLLHGGHGLHVDAEATPETKEEVAANEFARNQLIPAEFESAFRTLSLQAREVMRFARRVGVSPGIIVGQLQHSGRIGYDKLNYLKRRFEWQTELEASRGRR